jgi:hypothetical protein
MAAGDITLVFLNEALRLPGNRRASRSQPRTAMNFPDAGHNDAGTLWQEGSAYPTKFLWNLDWVILEYERDWLEWLQSVWVDAPFDTIGIWDETREVLTLNPPTRAIAPGTTGVNLSANKSRFYPQCQATLAPGTTLTLEDSGTYFSAQSWRLKLQLMEGSLLPYGGSLTPAVPGLIVPIVSSASSSGNVPTPPPTVNNPPTLTLGSNSGSVAEDADTTNPINLASVTVNDDGQGTNTLAISGTGTSILEIVGGQLRIKAGAALQPVGDIVATITVDDTTVGSTPDDSETFTLSITAAQEEETEVRTTNKALFSSTPDQTLYPVGTIVHYVQDLNTTPPTSAITDEHLVFASDEAFGFAFWKFVSGTTSSFNPPTGNPQGPRHRWIRYQTGLAPTITEPRATASGGGYYYTWT